MLSFCFPSRCRVAKSRRQFGDVLSISRLLYLPQPLGTSRFSSFASGHELRGGSYAYVFSTWNLENPRPLYQPDCQMACVTIVRNQFYALSVYQNSSKKRKEPETRMTREDIGSFSFPQPTFSFEPRGLQVHAFDKRGFVRT